VKRHLASSGLLTCGDTIGFAGASVDPGLEVSEPELTRLLRWETTDQQEALDPIAWQMLQGAQNLRRWIWTVVLVALVLLVIGLFPPSS
jgi:hypothetical protein